MISFQHRLYTDHVTEDGNVLTRVWRRTGRVQVMHWQTWTVWPDGTRSGVYVLADEAAILAENAEAKV